jgi:TPR repeat protein
VKWFRLAAEQGDAKAQANLGVKYDKGQGVPQDYALAYMWVSIAAVNASASELKQLAASYRDSIAKKMTAQQIAKAQQLAKKCTAKKFKGC